MLNAMQAWLLQYAVAEKEYYDGREKAKKQLTKLLNGESISRDTPEVGVHPGIVYDADGKPRPAPMAYDGTISDDPPRRRPVVVQPLPPETVPTDDYDNPFPGLEPPLG